LWQAFKNGIDFNIGDENLKIIEPSYLTGRNQKDRGSKPAQVSSS
jgi:hypothetical protein